MLKTIILTSNQLEMKKILLLSAVAMMTAASMSAQNPKDLPASDIPAGVTVTPTPNTKIDTSDNAFPLGMSSIAIEFGGKDIMKNPKNEEPAVLYRDDFSKPLDETLTTSIDMMTSQTAGVLFKNKYTADGQYKLVIPEGMFLYQSGMDDNGEPVGSEKCPGMTLYYTIFRGWTVQPADGMVVAEIERIVFTFPKASSVTFNTSSTPNFGTSTVVNSASMNWTVEGNKVYGTFDQGGISYTFQKPGNYLLHIQPGQFSFVVNGETYTNDEIRLSYTIPQTPEPEIWPYCDETVTEGFEYFELTIPAGWDTEDWFFMKDDMAQNPIYMVDADGNVDKSTKIAVAKLVQAESEGNYLYLALFDATNYEPLNFDWDKSANEWQSYAWTCKNVRPWKPEYSGQYALQLSGGLYSGYYTSPIVTPGATPARDYLNSDPYMFIYDVVGEKERNELSGVESAVAPESDTFDIYNISGICVARNANKATLNSLPAGLYIANGKKVVVK